MKMCSRCKTTKPLDRFHNDKRRVGGKFPQCKDCTKVADRERRLANLEASRQYDKDYYAKNKTKRKAYDQANKTRISARNKAYRERNLPTLRANALAYQKQNPDVFAAHAANRRAAKLQATPKWANKTKIRKIYAVAHQLAKLHGIPYQVDHIVPLVSDIVCGLHWEGNLHAIPKLQNITKGNRY